MVERLICLASLVIGYGFGIIQIAHLYSRSKNVNIREKGSGNAGTTNMFRVMGLKAGVITLVGDVSKAIIATLFTRWIFVTICGFNINLTALCLYTCCGCVLGHDFPFYMGFKGGKGMAVTAAMVVLLGNWQMIVLGILTFFITVAITRYVSLGSMLTVCFAAVEFIIFTQVGWFVVEPEWLIDCYIIFIFLAALLVWQHRGNVKRLINHNEKKFYFRSSEQIAKDEAAHREVQTNARVEQVKSRVDRRVDRIQTRTERKIENVANASERKKHRVYRIQNRNLRRVDHMQNRALYKEKKVQLKAQLKADNSNNWVGIIADHAPKYYRQTEENGEAKNKDDNKQ